MALTKKYSCVCQTVPNYLEQSWRKVCPYCLGRRWNVYPIDLKDYKGEFTRAIRWTNEPDGKVDIKNYREDIWIEITCECGDMVSFSEDSKQVCKCGRVYRLTTKIEKDDSHRGDFEYWKKEWDEYSED